MESDVKGTQVKGLIYLKNDMGINGSDSDDYRFVEERTLTNSVITQLYPGHYV